jgi:hypothetical protein
MSFTEIRFTRDGSSAASVDGRVKSYTVHGTVLCGLRVRTSCCVIGYEVIT